MRIIKYSTGDNSTSLRGWQNNIKTTTDNKQSNKFHCNYVVLFKAITLASHCILFVRTVKLTPRSTSLRDIVCVVAAHCRHSPWLDRRLRTINVSACRETTTTTRLDCIQLHSQQQLSNGRNRDWLLASVNVRCRVRLLVY